MAFASMTVVQGRPLVPLDSELSLRCQIDLTAIKIDGQPATIAALNAAAGTQSTITIAAPATKIAEWENNDPQADEGIVLKAFGARGLRFFVLSTVNDPNNLDISIHGTGRLTGTGVDRKLSLQTGSVRIWSRVGFATSRFFSFDTTIPVEQTYAQWRETVWPENAVDIAAFVFGAQLVVI